MSFADLLLFPTDISYGSSGGPSFRNILQVTPTRVSVVQRTLEPPGTWNAKWTHSAEASAAIISFARAVHGSLVGFRFLDWNDYSTTPEHVGPWNGSTLSHRHSLGSADGTSTRYPLVKTYSVGATARTRRIRKPMRLTEAQSATNLDVSAITDEADMHAVWVGGVAATIGVDFSIDYEEGEVVFASAPTIGVSIEWAGYFVVPARLGPNSDKQLSLITQNFGERQYDDIDVIEDVDPTSLTVCEQRGRGASSFTESVSATQRVLGIGDGELIQIDADAAAASPFPLKLPVLKTWMLGGDWFRILNVGSVDSIALQDSAGSAVATITAGSQATLVVGLDGSGNPQWVVL